MLASPTPVTSDHAVLEARHLTVVLGGRNGLLRRGRDPVRAVDNVSLQLRRGETLGICGESGSGKTTLARTLLGVQRETSGEIWLDGKRVDGMDPKGARRTRRAIQYLHQDAGGSLDPWWSVGNSIIEAMKINKIVGDRRTELIQILGAVSLGPDVIARYPHQLSGGQLRRVALARIMLLHPEVLILDEPTAGLDLSIQAAVLNLFLSIKQAFATTNLLISHDIAVLKLVCDRLAIMHNGRIVEELNAAELSGGGQHPYTQKLLGAAPKLPE